MYFLYRRHEKDCKVADQGVRNFKCPCPIWMDGYDEMGRRKRRSLKTRNWRHAQELLERIESGEPVPAVKPVDHGPTVESAITRYLDDCESRHLEVSTVTSYRNGLAHFQRFFAAAKISTLDVDALDRYRKSRAAAAGRKLDTITPRTQAKELESLRSFLKFAVTRKWIPENYAAHLKAPADSGPPTMPFTADEVAAILDACEKIDNPNQREIARARLRARALVLLLLYSGLRISDAVRLERSKLDMKTGRLLIRTMKTGVPLYTKVPGDAIAALAAVPREGKYFFWSGRSKLSTAVGSARRTIACVLKLAQVEDGHPHRFRDTFSVELLNHGTDLRTVQLLLGHKSIKTTEKHYAPFVRSMQQGLDEAVSRLHFGSVPAPFLVDPKKHAFRDTKGSLGMALALA